MHTKMAWPSTCARLVLTALTLASPVRAQIKNITVTDAMLARDKGGGPKDAPASFWTPNIVVTNDGTIVIMALAKPLYHNYMVSSRDGGKTWLLHQEPMGPPGTSQLLYSHASDT